MNYMKCRVRLPHKEEIPALTKGQKFSLLQSFSLSNLSRVNPHAKPINKVPLTILSVRLSSLLTPWVNPLSTQINERSVKKIKSNQYFQDRLPGHQLADHLRVQRMNVWKWSSRLWVWVSTSLFFFAGETKESPYVLAIKTGKHLGSSGKQTKNMNKMACFQGAKEKITLTWPCKFYAALSHK